MNEGLTSISHSNRRNFSSLIFVVVVITQPLPSISFSYYARLCKLVNHFEISELVDFGKRNEENVQQNDTHSARSKCPLRRK